MDDPPLIGIGLSQENLARLLDGRPIYKPLSDWYPGMGGHVLIVAGATEESIQADLRSVLAEHGGSSSPVPSEEQP